MGAPRHFNQPLLEGAAQSADIFAPGHPALIPIEPSRAPFISGAAQGGLIGICLVADAVSKPGWVTPRATSKALQSTACVLLLRFHIRSSIQCSELRSYYGIAPAQCSLVCASGLLVRASEPSQSRPDLG